MITNRPYLLSVCIPAYNRPEWFRRSLESIVRSSCSPQVEIIVSDDSTNALCEDITKEILNSWNGEWFYTHHQPSLGMAANWNHAVKLASGEYVLILHDDDFLIDNGLDFILNTIKKYQSQQNLFLFGVNVVDEQERILKRQTFSKLTVLAPKSSLICLLANSSFVRFPAIVIGRGLLQDMGYFDTKVKGPADLAMWIKLFSSSGLVCVPVTTCAYTVHSSALTMGMFNAENIAILTGLFDYADSLNLLTDKELNRCKSLFFHQFILAGAFRQLKRKKWREFVEIMDLFKLQEMRNLSIPIKWILIRMIFFILAGFLLQATS